MLEQQKTGQHERTRRPDGFSASFGSSPGARRTERVSDSPFSVSSSEGICPGSVEGWLDDPNYAQDGLLQEIPYPETARYVEKVEQAYDAYTSLYPDLFTDGSFESSAK